MPQQRLYQSDFTTPRPRGRPPARWKDQVRADVGISLQDAERHAQGRPEWREEDDSEESEGTLRPMQLSQ